MIVNDLIVVGALPQVVNAYFAIGDSDWMDDKKRAMDLIDGWAAACNEIGAAWGGGETPTLKGIIEPSTIDIGGSSVGIIGDKNNLVLGDKLKAGDAIIIIESSGIHANGISLVRQLAASKPGTYEAKLANKKSFGEAILTPTHLYVSLVRNLQKKQTEIHYMVNVTGHGWRKLMRATKPFSYLINKLPPVQPEFSYIQKQLELTTEDMYANFNMGAGFAIYVPADQVKKVINEAKKLGFKAWQAGLVKNGPKQVVIEPLNITFNSLGVR